jgi:epoxide hydrolase
MVAPGTYRMNRRFLAMGSDWSTSISTGLALQYPGRLLGIHLVPPLDG